MYSMRSKIFIFILWSILHAALVPSPPSSPELKAVGNHEQIKLMWDGTAESSIDSLTGYSDFEGYRLYRSTDGGNTWGKSWQKIKDNSGNHVGWQPHAQFDLPSELDSLHCMYTHGYYDLLIDGDAQLEFDLISVPVYSTLNYHVHLFDFRGNVKQQIGKTNIIFSFGQIIPIIKRADSSPIKFKQEIKPQPKPQEINDILEEDDYIYVETRHRGGISYSISIEYNW